MIIESVSFRNFSVLKHLDLRFETGVTVIAGPMGTGKSTLLRGVRGVLTGDFATRSLGGQQADRSHTSKKGDTVSAELAGRLVDGRHFRVRRVILGPGDSFLHVHDADGKEVLQAGPKEGDITAAIAQLFGATTATISKIMFVDQYRTDALVTATESERVSILSDLGGLETISQADSILAAQEAAERTRIGDYNPHEYALAEAERPRVQTYRKLKLELREAVEQQRAVESQRGEHDPEQSRLDEAQKIVQDAEYASTITEKLEGNRKRRHEAKTERDQFKEDLDKIHKRLEKRKQRLQELQQAERDHEAQASLVGAASRDLRAYRRLQAVLEQQPPSPPKIPEGLKECPGEYLQEPSLLRDKIIETNAQAIDLERRLKAVRAGVCSQCGTPAEAIGNEQTLLAEVESLKQQEQTYREQDAMIEAYLDKVEEYDDEVAELEEQQKQAREELAGYEQEPVVPRLEEFDDTELKSVKKEVASLVSQASLLQQRHEDRGNRYATLRGEYKSLKQQKESLHPWSSRKSRVEAAKQFRAQYKELSDRVADLREQASRARSEAANVLRRMRAARAAERTNRKLVEIADTVKRARGYLVRKKLPAVVLYNLFAAIVTNANKRLVQVGAGFTLEPKMAAELLARQPNKPDMLGKRLSGGQRFIAGMCLSLAAVESFGGTFASIWLDEPTAGIDRQMMPQLATLVQRLNQHLVRENRQLLIVTHDEVLMQTGRTVSLNSATEDSRDTKLLAIE